jgi:hypothetical protein
MGGFDCSLEVSVRDKWFLGVCAASVLTMTACNSDSGDSGDGGASGSSCKGGVTITGVVKEFEPKIERQRFKTVSGVKVCVYQHDEVPCDTTDSSGTFSLCGVPEDSDLLLSFQKTNYAKALRMLTTRKDDYDILAETAIGTLDLGIAEAGMHGLDLKTVDGGVIQFFAAEPANGVLQVALLGDYSAELLDLDGNPAQCISDKGDVPCKPLYLDELGEPAPALTKATKKGVGAFGNVKPGEYLLRIKHPTLDCTSHLPEAGWHADAKDEVRVKAVDEWITSQVGVFCQPPE